jgi:hypothetical protein
LTDSLLSEVKPPILLIVSSLDTIYLEKNQMLLKNLNSGKKLMHISGITHLLEEPGELDEVTEQAKRWFYKHSISDELKDTMNCLCSRIGSYSFGFMIVDGNVYDEDIIVFPGKVKANWWRNDSHILRMDDLREVVEFKPELLILGTGSSGRMRMEPVTKDGLRQEGIKFVEKLTGKAIKLFNKETAKGTKVVGAFHLTC